MCVIFFDKKKMTLINSLTNKQKRSIELDLKVIFSTKGLWLPKTIDDFTKTGLFTPYVNYKDKQIYFSEASIKAIKRICTFIESTNAYSDLMSFNDIYQAVKDEIERWLNELLVPNFIEFIEPLEQKLSQKIEAYIFICRIAGITLKDIDCLEFGSKRIGPFCVDAISHLEFPGGIDLDSIEKEYKNHLIITGSETGSHSVAREKFFFTSELALSALRMYSCVLFEQAIHKGDVRLVNESTNSSCNLASYVIGYCAKDNEATLSCHNNTHNHFELGHDILNHLKSNYFFDELGKLIEKKDKTKLEKIITTAIYWYGEAYKDKNNDSKYIKLWSAAECFFPTNKNKRTQLNAKNISTLMVCGGYGYITPDEYDNLKRKIVRYYELRSNILHKGEYGHVDGPSLEHFSVIVAYVILTTVSLTCLGYTTIEQALKEINRLSSNLER